MYRVKGSGVPGREPWGRITNVSPERPPTLVNQNVSAGIVTSCASNESLNDVSRRSGPAAARPTGATNSSAGCVASLAAYVSHLPSRVIAGPVSCRSPVVIWRTGPPVAGAANTWMLPRVSAVKYTVFESGDQAGPEGSRSQPLVRLRTGPPPPHPAAAGITHTSFSSPRPLEQLKAMAVPSGD